MNIPDRMTAMVLEAPNRPLRKTTVPVPVPGHGEVLVEVHACGVCRTDLHIVDGELDLPRLPLIPGHEIVGTIVAAGPGVPGTGVGRRIGVPWLGRTCGTCAFCKTGRENLCDNARFTGYSLDGGYAEYAITDERYCFDLPGSYDDIHACPLLCAGLIGFRAYRMVPGDARNIGIYGFGAAAHIVTQVAVHEGKSIYAFTRPGNEASRQFARSCGALWAGGSDRPPPVELDAAIVFASVGALVPAALGAYAKGGVVICAGIHMSDIPSFPYRTLWQERIVRSVANLTRRDGTDFFALASRVPLKTAVTVFPLDNANGALGSIRSGLIQGAAVVVP